MGKSDSGKEFKKAIMWGALAAGVYNLLKSESKKDSTPNDSILTVSSGDIDGYLKETVGDIQKAMEKVRPLLNFKDVVQKIKIAENTDLGQAQVAIKNETDETKIVWKVFADLELKIGGITWGYSTKEPADAQHKRDEMRKLNNFAGSFKNLLVTRGRVLRHLRYMYSGKNKRPETQEREGRELKNLMLLFQTDADRCTGEVAIFNEVIEKIKAIS